MRTYMMDLDTISNCSNVSRPPEDIESSESILSSLRIYQDEFVELHHLINPTNYSHPFSTLSTPTKNTSLLCEENDLNSIASNLRNHFADCRQIQDKSRLNLYNIEKSIEIKYCNKIEKLLKSNHKLQLELDSANEQISRLLKNYSKRNGSCLLDKGFIQSEMKYHDLTTQYSQLQIAYFQNRQEKEEYEIENKQLKVELCELKIDIDTKNECVKELKNKVSQQYVEIETVNKKNFQFSQILSEISTELEYIKKTRDWFKERLHICQNERQTLSDEILRYKTELNSQNEILVNLNADLCKWKANCEAIELKALQDKEDLHKRLASVQFMNNEKNISRQMCTYISEDKAIVHNFNEGHIQDLTHEIRKIKDYVQEQDNVIEKITKENSELVARCITLQNNIRHNEIVIEELEYNKKQMLAELEDLKCKCKENLNEIAIRENRILSLQADLTLKTDEQELVENTVRTLRDQFTIFKSKYKELVAELSIKNKQILQLENEKQKLFMENNWNICELQKLSEKDAIINQLKDELMKNNKTINNNLEAMETLKSEMYLNEENKIILLNEKQYIIDKDHLEMKRYEDVLTQYKIMVTNYENKVFELQELLNKSNVKLADLKDTIKILNQEVNKRDTNLNELHNKYVILENELKFTKNNTVFNNRSEDDTKKFECGTVHLENYQETEEKKIISNRSVNAVHRSNLKKHLMLRIHELEERVKKLNGTCHECYTTLNNVFNIVKDAKGHEEVQKLSILLQVKEKELEEKQKRYEVNNRTLLKKVKEQMKGRNAAEKQNQYLQEMYNSLSDENNSLKLEIAATACQIDKLKADVNGYTNIKGKPDLDGKLLENNACEQCYISHESSELLGNEFENERLSFANILTVKENAITKLQNEIEHLLQTNLSLNTCNKKLTNETRSLIHENEILTNTVKNLDNEVKQLELKVGELNDLIKEQNSDKSKALIENSNLKNSLEEINQQVEYLSSERKIISSRLHVKSEALSQLEDRKSTMEKKWLEKELHFQTIVSTLRRYMHDLQLENISVNNEKRFLKRLCRDLKTTLNSYASHNKVLQQLNVVSKESDFNSLPNVLPNIPCDIKFDEDYISQLLQENRYPLQSKPVTEIKSCLDTLKREVSNLQEHIARKNIQH